MILDHNDTVRGTKLWWWRNGIFESATESSLEVLGSLHFQICGCEKWYCLQELCGGTSVNPMDWEVFESEVYIRFGLIYKKHTPRFAVQKPSNILSVVNILFPHIITHKWVLLRLIACNFYAALMLLSFQWHSFGN